ncbi:hypothetical protein [Streptomyces sp. NPDC058695]
MPGTSRWQSRQQLPPESAEPATPATVTTSRPTGSGVNASSEP